jgi:hypothetical protein
MLTESWVLVISKSTLGSGYHGICFATVNQAQAKFLIQLNPLSF